MYKVFEENEMAKMCRVIGKWYCQFASSQIHIAFFRAIEEQHRLLLACIQAWMRGNGENTTKAGVP